MKVTIVFSSGTGHNLEIARWVEDEAKKMGAEVRVRKVEELALPAELNPGQAAYQEAAKDIEVASSDDIAWADTLFFSTPARFGTATAAMKFFIESQVGLWAQGKLVNKVVSAFATAQNLHGGQEQAVLSIYTSMMHWGAIIVPPGYSSDVLFGAGGNPYGVSGSADRNGFGEDIEGAVRHQARRTIEISEKLNR